MGLFSNHKKLCPICGKPTPRLLATKIEDMPICKECDQKIDLPNGAMDNMTLNRFQQYLKFYDDNRVLRETFSEEYRYDFGFFGGCFLMDNKHKLFKIKASDNALVMRADQLKSFRILEDNRPLYTSGDNVLVNHKSNVPAQIRKLERQIDEFVRRREEYEYEEERERRREERLRDNGALPPTVNSSRSSSWRTRPTFDPVLPFRQFHVELVFQHPYWGSIKWDLDAPTMDSNYPSMEDYLQEYENTTHKLHTLAINMMRMKVPGAKETFEGEINKAKAVTNMIPKAGSTKAAPSGNVIGELKQYKELLDSGVITEEEFAAKKKQLMGI